VNKAQKSSNPSSRTCSVLSVILRDFVAIVRQIAVIMRGVFICQPPLCKQCIWPHFLHRCGLNHLHCGPVAVKTRLAEALGETTLTRFPGLTRRGLSFGAAALADFNNSTS
jgi:hypothetical protein